MAVYDIIRTGHPDFNAFWHVRTSQSSFNSSSTLRIKLKQYIDEIAFQPIPQVFLPAEHSILLEEWIDETTQDGLVIQRMAIRPGVPSILMRATTIPILFCNDMWKIFIGEIDNLLDAKLRQKEWDNSSNITRLNDKIDELQGELTISKANELQATERAQTTLKESKQKLERLETQNTLALQEAEDKAKILAIPSKKPTIALNKLKEERDSLLIQRDKAALDLIETEAKLQKALARIKQKDKTIKSILAQQKRGNENQPPNLAPRSRTQNMDIANPNLVSTGPAPGPSSIEPPPNTDYIAREVAFRFRQHELDERERALNARDMTHRDLEGWSNSRHSPY